MGSPRYVVLGLAHVRSGWFRAVGRWADAAMIPIDFQRCVSIEELRALLATGRPFSALLVDVSLPGVDRDLIDTADGTGTTVIIVDDRHRPRPWIDIGASAVLSDGFRHRELLDALRRHSTPIEHVDRVPDPQTRGNEIADDDIADWQGRLVAVTGPGGAGSSTLAMALAQGMAADPRQAGLVALADCCLDADLAMMHDAADATPGIQELVDAHRLGSPRVDEIRALTHDGAERGYRLVLGLRRHHHWTAVRVRAFEAALISLRRCHRTVIADVDDDIEGEAETGSADVEDRNLMARTVIPRADLVLVVGLPTLTGLHHLVRSYLRLMDAGLEPQRVLPILNRSPRGARTRAMATSTLAGLVGAERLSHNPLHLVERRGVEEALLDGVPLPRALADSITRSVTALLEVLDDREIDDPAAPTPIRPGSLGHWPREEAG